MHPIRTFHLGVLCAWLVAGNALFADDWPQWLGPNRDAVWREDGIVEKFPTNGPPVRWRAGIGGGYAGPSVANGRVYVADRQRSPDASIERVLCLSEADGTLLWKQEYDCPYKIDYPGTCSASTRTTVKSCGRWISRRSSASRRPFGVLRGTRCSMATA